MLFPAIRTYHDLLTTDPAAASQECLGEQQERRGVSFGNRALCTVLRPEFLSVDEYRFLRSRTNVLVQAFEASMQREAHSALRRGITSRSEMRLKPKEPRTK